MKLVEFLSSVLPERGMCCHLVQCWIIQTLFPSGEHGGRRKAGGIPRGLSHTGWFHLSSVSPRSCPGVGQTDAGAAPGTGTIGVIKQGCILQCCTGEGILGAMQFRLEL